MLDMTAPRTRRVVNNTWIDLHPDDLANRVALRDYLYASSVGQGLSEPELSKAAGYQTGWAKGVWSQSSWRLSTVQLLVRTLGYQLDLDVSTVGVRLAPQDPAIAGLRSMFRAGTRDGDEVDRRWLADLGRRLRVGLGVERAELGHALKMSGTRVRDWEEGDGPDYLLLTAQRYFRALGRPLYPLLRLHSGTLVVPIGMRMGGSQGLSGAGANDVQVEEGPVVTRLWNRAYPSTMVEFPTAVWKQWLARQTVGIDA